MDELKEFIKKFFKDCTPRIWFVSPYEREEVFSDLEKSKFYTEVVKESK